MTNAVHSFDIPARTPAATSLIEQVSAKLRAAIMHGELRPGQKLVEADLSRTLGVSRASLREALRALEAEKLISIIPNRGPSVARIDARDIDAIQDVWALLTGDAVVDFTRRASTQDIAALERRLDALKLAINANAPLDQLDATNRFLGFMIKRHGNAVLAEVVATLVARINFLRAQALLRQGWGAVHACEIEAILDAIRARNPEAARDRTRKHIASACAAARHVALVPGLVGSATLQRRERWDGDFENELRATAA